jgi:RecA/RadA recombinase
VLNCNFIKLQKKKKKSLHKLEEVIIEKKVRLLVVDSIASVARREYETAGGGLRHRQAQLGKEAGLLKYLAETFHIPVLVTNQVTSRSSSHEPAFDFYTHSTLVKHSIETYTLQKRNWN